MTAIFLCLEEKPGILTKDAPRRDMQLRLAIKRHLQSPLETVRDHYGLDPGRIVLSQGDQYTTVLIKLLVDAGQQDRLAGDLDRGMRNLPNIFNYQHSKDDLYGQFMTERIIPAETDGAAWTPKRKAAKNHSARNPWGNQDFQFPGKAKTLNARKKILDLHGGLTVLDRQNLIPIGCVTVAAWARAASRNDTELMRHLGDWLIGRHMQIQWSHTDSLGAGPAHYFAATLVRLMQSGAKPREYIKELLWRCRWIGPTIDQNLSTYAFRKPNVFGVSAADIMRESQIRELVDFAEELGENLPVEPPRPLDVPVSQTGPGQATARSFFYAALPSERERALEELREILEHGIGDADAIDQTLKRCADAGIDLGNVHVYDDNRLHEGAIPILGWLMRREAQTYDVVSRPPKKKAENDTLGSRQENALRIATQIIRHCPDALDRAGLEAPWCYRAPGKTSRMINVPVAFMPWMNAIDFADENLQIQGTAKDLCEASGDWPAPDRTGSNGKNFPNTVCTLFHAWHLSYWGLQELIRHYSPRDFMVPDREGRTALTEAQQILMENQTGLTAKNNPDLEELIQQCMADAVNHGTGGHQPCNSEPIAQAENPPNHANSRVRGTPTGRMT